MNPSQSMVERTVGHAAHWVIYHPAVPLGIAGVLALLTLIANWRIFVRAGYGGCWSLLLLVPIANLFAVLHLAFVRWPVQGRRAKH